MARAMLSHRLSDQTGRVQPYTSVLMLETDGVTPLAQTLYVNPTGGEIRTNPLTTDSLGMLVAYAETPQRAIARLASMSGPIDTVIDIEDDPADTLSAPIPLGNLAAVTANQVLKGNGSGVVGGGLLINANVDPSAGIAHSKLASTTPHFVLRAAGGGTMGAGLLTANNISPGTLTPATLAAGAVTQAPPVATGTTDPTTTSASPVAFADPILPMNTTGGYIDVEAVVTMSCNVANAALGLYARLDAGPWELIGYGSPDSTSQSVQVSGFARFLGVSGTVAVPVAHTVHLGWSTNNGTVSSLGVSRRLRATEVLR